MKHYQQKYIDLKKPNSATLIRSNYNKLLQQVSENNIAFNSLVCQQIEELKSLLYSLRAKVLEGIDLDHSLQGLYQSISPDMTHRNHEEQLHRDKKVDYNIRPGVGKSLPGVLALAYKQSELDLERAGLSKPCDYAVMSLGSIALQQATAYSDLEFAILTENEHYKRDSDLKIRDYFINLTHLVHFRIIQLGETLWWRDGAGTIHFDEVTSNVVSEGNIKKGISFDTWDKTPFGKDNVYELVKTTEGFLEYLRNVDGAAQQKDPLLHSMLETTRFVYGKESLFKAYHKASCQELQKDYRHNNDNNRFKKMIAEDRAPIGEYTQGSKLLATQAILTQCTASIEAIRKFLIGEYPTLDVKQDIYRLVDRALYNYAGKHGWFQESIFQLIHRLYDGKNKHIIDEETSQYLSQMTSFAMKLKLLHHTHNKGRENRGVDIEFLEALGLKAELTKYVNHAQRFKDKLESEINYIATIEADEVDGAGAAILWVEVGNYNHQLKSDRFIYKWGKKFTKEDSEHFIKSHDLESCFCSTDHNNIEGFVPLIGDENINDRA